MLRAPLIVQAPVAVQVPDAHLTMNGLFAGQLALMVRLPL
jgi:hypothetical protein